VNVDPRKQLTDARQLAAAIRCDLDEIVTAAERLKIVPAVRVEGVSIFDQGQCDQITQELARLRSEAHDG
jgi:hypothetical protein